MSQKYRRNGAILFMKSSKESSRGSINLITEIRTVVGSLYLKQVEQMASVNLVFFYRTNTTSGSEKFGLVYIISINKTIFQ